MAHIKTLGAARFADLSMSLVAGGAATNQPSFSDMERIVAAIKSVPDKSGLSNADNGALSAVVNPLGTSGKMALTTSLFAAEAVVGDGFTTNTAYTPSLSPKFVRITHVKEFPAMGTPANIVKVPVYGKKNSIQIQGQADAPTMELTLNYIPALWADGHVHVDATTPVKLFPKVADGNIYLFRFTLLDLKPEGYAAVKDTASDNESIAGDATTLSAVNNTSYYFLGKLEAMEVTPSLTDAITAKLTIAVQSEIYGAFTVD
jgi:hypothetical protein